MIANNNSNRVALVGVLPSPGNGLSTWKVVLRRWSFKWRPLCWSLGSDTLCQTPTDLQEFSEKTSICSSQSFNAIDWSVDSAVVYKQQIKKTTIDLNGWETTATILQRSFPQVVMDTIANFQSIFSMIQSLEELRAFSK
ncbi:hypothetical protein GCK32_015171 [Trichostrongylus colubriformis]|uniref:Uncharacterized protein n=1 Tax=Trichostrongylus colubriformis TaxID=6319 RepID=A0AAN8FR02_TRICO